MRISSAAVDPPFAVSSMRRQTYSSDSRNSGVAPTTLIKERTMEIRPSDYAELVKALGVEWIGTYRYISPLGGGKASTTLKYSNGTEEIVVKLLVCPRNEEERTTFIDEGNMLKRVTDEHHDVFLPRIVVPLTKVPNMPAYYFGMEMFEGLTLAQYIKEQPLPWDWKKSVTIISKILFALGNSLTFVVHRDLHPGNIFITDTNLLLNDDFSPDDPGVRILDFGCNKDLIAEYWNGRESKDNFRLFGARLTWSPEFINDPASVGYKHDVWAAGVMLFRFLTNEKHENCGNLAELVTLYQGDHALDVPTISAPYAVVALLQNMLSFDPNTRLAFAEIEKMVDDLIHTDLADMGNSFIDAYLENGGEYWLCCCCHHYTLGRGSRCGRCGVALDDENHLKVRIFRDIEANPDRIVKTA